MSSYFNQITEPLLMQSYATLFLISFILCVVIILASGYGFSRRASLDEAAVQSAHSGFVPRVGGLAIYISILGLIPLLSFGFIPLAVVLDLNATEITWLILSFPFPLSEDFTLMFHVASNLIKGLKLSWIVADVICKYSR